MVKNSLHIQDLAYEHLNGLLTLESSLKKELEYTLTDPNCTEKVFKSKTRQVGYVNSVIATHEVILKNLTDLFELQQKCEFCLINYGISPDEYKWFIKDSLLEIMAKMYEKKQAGQLDLPIIFTHVLDYSVLKPEEWKENITKTVDKPVMGFEKLKEMAKNNPGILTKNI